LTVQYVAVLLSVERLSTARCLPPRCSTTCRDRSPVSGGPN